MPGKPITPEGLERDLDYTLHGIEVHRLLSRVCPPAPDLKVLEPGCGSGKMGLWYAARHADVTLLDIDPGVLDYTRALYEKLKQTVACPLAVRIVEGDLHKLGQLYSAEFDYVFNEGISHHWPTGDPRRQGSLDQMVKVTKLGGYVCVVVSNARSREMMEYAQRVFHTYAGMPPTQEPFWPDDLALGLQKAGLSGVHVEPVYGSRWADSSLLAGWGRKA